MPRTWRYTYTVPPEPQSFGAALRARREELGLTQDQLAECAEVYQGQVSHWETGRIKAPDPTTVANLEDCLRVVRGTLGELVHLRAMSRKAKQQPPKPGSVVIEPESPLLPLVTEMEELDEADVGKLREWIRTLLDGRRPGRAKDIGT